MPETKQQPAKCIYQVIATEFWQKSFRIEAVDPADALVTYDLMKQLNALPTPKYTLLGSVDPAEQVLDEAGKIVLDNAPPGDDNERMLLREMWRRMYFSQAALPSAILTGLRFVCAQKKWDADEMWKEVRNS